MLLKDHEGKLSYIWLKTIMKCKIINEKDATCIRHIPFKSVWSVRFFFFYFFEINEYLFCSTMTHLIKCDRKYIYNVANDFCFR